MACRAAVASLLDRALPSRHCQKSPDGVELHASASASECSAGAVGGVFVMDDGVSQDRSDDIRVQALEIQHVLQRAFEAGKAASASIEAAMAAIAACRTACGTDLRKAAPAVDVPRISSMAHLAGGAPLACAGFMAHRHSPWSWSRIFCLTSGVVRAL
jgi:hypothetical protein